MLRERSSAALASSLDAPTVDACRLNLLRLQRFVRSPELNADVNAEFDLPSFNSALGRELLETRALLMGSTTLPPQPAAEPLAPGRLASFEALRWLELSLLSEPPVAGTAATSRALQQSTDAMVRAMAVTLQRLAALRAGAPSSPPAGPQVAPYFRDLREQDALWEPWTLRATVADKGGPLPDVSPSMSPELGRTPPREPAMSPGTAPTGRPGRSYPSAPSPSPPGPAQGPSGWQAGPPSPGGYTSSAPVRPGARRYRAVRHPVKAEQALSILVVAGILGVGVLFAVHVLGFGWPAAVICTVVVFVAVAALAFISARRGLGGTFAQCRLRLVIRPGPLGGLRLTASSVSTVADLAPRRWATRWLQTQMRSLSGPKVPDGWSMEMSDPQSAHFELDPISFGRPPTTLVVELDVDGTSIPLHWEQRLGTLAADRRTPSLWSCARNLDGRIRCGRTSG